MRVALAICVVVAHYDNVQACLNRAVLDAFLRGGNRTTPAHSPSESPVLCNSGRTLATEGGHSSACSRGPRLAHSAAIVAALKWCDGECATPLHPLWPYMNNVAAWSTRPQGDVAWRAAAFAAALERGQGVSVVVYGGSATRGADCTDPVGRTEEACCYAARLVDALRGRGVVELVPRAMNALNSLGLLPLLGKSPIVAQAGVPTGHPGVFRERLAGQGSFHTLKGARLVLVDFSINDALLEANISAAATERFLRFLLEKHEHTAPTLIETFPGATEAQRAARQAVARHYGVPVVTVPAVAWPRGKAFQGYGAHPDWTAHQLIGDALFAWWEATASSPPAGGKPPPLPPPLMPSDILGTLVPCDAHAAVFGHVANGVWEKSAAPRASGDWAKVAEAGGTKPGLVSVQAGAQLEFVNLPFEVGLLQITYLKGYDMAGTVRVDVSGVSHKYALRRSGGAHNILKAQRNDGVQATTRAVWTDQPFVGARNATVTLTHVQPGKFKLIALTTC